MAQSLYDKQLDAVLQYKGGRILKDGLGYLLEYCPLHPACNKAGFVRQHRLVMERRLGRFLSGIEVVHHRNGDGEDNRFENLVLFENQAEHMRHHQLALTKRYDFRMLERLRPLAENPTVSIKAAAAQLKISHTTVWAIVLDHNIEWNGVDCRRGCHLDPALVATTLEKYQRKEAAKILGVSIQTLWNHFPELMRRTARQKSLRRRDPSAEPAPQTASRP